MKKSTQRTRSNYCSKCKAHNEMELMAGHKGNCPYENCFCESCLVIIKRREIFAANIYLTRNGKTRQNKKSFDLSEVFNEYIPEFMKLANGNGDDAKKMIELALSAHLNFVKIQKSPAAEKDLTMTCDEEGISIGMIPSPSTSIDDDLNIAVAYIDEDIKQMVHQARDYH